MWRASILGVLLSGCGFSVAGSNNPLDPDGGRDAMRSDDAPVDGNDDRRDGPLPPDAAEFDPARCPPNYVEVPGLPHRYRWDLTAGPEQLRTWQDSVQLCAADTTISAAYTPHLIIAETPAEAQMFFAHFGPMNNFAWFWTGVSRDSDNAPWQTILGDPYTPAFGDGLLAIDSASLSRGIAFGTRPTGTMPGDISMDREWTQRTICECDGRMP